MEKIVIKRITSEEECDLCDEFLTKLNSYESQFDEVLESGFKFSEIHKRSLKNDYTYLAIASCDNPVGYVFAYLKNVKGKVHNTNIVEIEALFVEDGYRGKKIGKELVDSVFCWAKECFGDDFVIELHAINNNVNAISFYKHLGFKEVRTVFRK